MPVTDESFQSTSFEQSPDVRQRFSDFVRTHALHEGEEPVANTESEESEEAVTREYALAEGSLDIPARALRFYNNETPQFTRQQIEFYGESILGKELIMTMLQEHGEDTQLFVNKTTRLKLGEPNVVTMIDKLTGLEASGDMTPKE